MNAIRTFIVASAIALTGCASGPTRNPADPLEPLNRGVYKFNDAVDKAVIKPVAKGYNAVVPPPIKMMVTNFFSNLDDVIVTANDVLQLKLVQGLADGTRFVVNSTIGFYGVADVASMVGLEKHNEDFGQTLGKWGVGNGPYLVLPILGPSTLRDSIGLYVDGRPSKLRRVNHMRTRNQLYVTKAINRRSQLLDQEKVIEEAAAIDRYEFVRDAYLLRRKNLVYDGNPPHEYDEDLENGENYDQVPLPNLPSSMQDVAPVTEPSAQPAAPTAEAAPTLGDAAPDANSATPDETAPDASTPDSVAATEAAPGDTSQPAAAAAPQPDTEAPGVHKVWVSEGTRDTGLN